MIYMNNAATGFPKFPHTIQAISKALTEGALSANRDSVVSKQASEAVFELREGISKLFRATKPHEICFTPSDTIAINMLMQGLNLKEDDVLIIDGMGHNAISRPAMALAKNCGVVVVSVSSIQELGFAIRNHGHRIKAAFFSHGSNVTGDVIDAEAIGKILYDNNIPFILDVAQTIGLYPIDAEKFHLSAAAFAGHKGLNGPQGTGGFYIRKGFHISPVLFGGTGTESMSLSPEEIFPDSFEVGTPAMHDLIGLHSAVNTIFGIGEDEYASHIRNIAQYACSKLSDIEGVTIYGETEKKLPVISFNIKGKTCQEVGMALASNGIICRTGIHCAALAVRKLGVVNEYGGTVRVSFGWASNDSEVDTLVKAIRKISSK